MVGRLRRKFVAVPFESLRFERSLSTGIPVFAGDGGIPFPAASETRSTEWFCQARRAILSLKWKRSG